MKHEIAFWERIGERLRLFFKFLQLSIITAIFSLLDWIRANPLRMKIFMPLSCIFELIVFLYDTAEFDEQKNKNFSRILNLSINSLAVSGSVVAALGVLGSVPFIVASMGYIFLLVFSIKAIYQLGDIAYLGLKISQCVEGSELRSDLEAKIKKESIEAFFTVMIGVSIAFGMVALAPVAPFGFLILGAVITALAACYAVWSGLKKTEAREKSESFAPLLSAERQERYPSGEEMPFPAGEAVDWESQPLRQESAIDRVNDTTYWKDMIRTFKESEEDPEIKKRKFLQNVLVPKIIKLWNQVKSKESDKIRRINLDFEEGLQYGDKNSISYLQSILNNPIHNIRGRRIAKQLDKLETMLAVAQIIDGKKPMAVKLGKELMVIENFDHLKEFIETSDNQVHKSWWKDKGATDSILDSAIYLSENGFFSHNDGEEIKQREPAHTLNAVYFRPR